MNNADTIVAIATPTGVGGIAVVRLSGSSALEMALRHLSVDSLSSRHATYCHFDNLDDVVALYLPVGYTGEPTMEISCHGSVFIQRTIVQQFIDDGARLAERGEYTMRAFLNHRLDLSQAEAVADLIDAVSSSQHNLAISQLRGGYSHRLSELRRQLIDFAALLELELDFSGEDVEFADRKQLNDLLSALNSQLSALLDSFRIGNELKRGVPVAIIGEPNAGKSSLLNTLVGDDRAIVSPIPGTTRDTVEECVTIGGTLFRFIDTAGLRQTDDTIEAMGVERARRAADAASVVLYVHDATTNWQPPQLALDPDKSIVVFNKADLKPDFNTPEIENHYSVISAKTGTGIDELKQLMAELVAQAVPDGDGVMLTNARHYQAMLRVQESLNLVRQGLDAGTPADLVAVDLRDALYHLGAITGEVTSEDLLSSIFSRFCIGK